MEETEIFHKLQSLLETRGLEFPKPTQYQYWHDPAFKAIFSLLVELFEREENGTTNRTY